MTIHLGVFCLLFTPINLFVSIFCFGVVYYNYTRILKPEYKL